MKGSYVKTIGGWQPNDRMTEESDKYKIGDVCMHEIRKPRSIKQHNRMMAFLQVVLNNQDRYPSIDALLTELKLKCGHYEQHINWKRNDDGEYIDSVVFIPKSISFGAMEQDAFVAFETKAYDAVTNDIIPGLNREDLEQAVIEFESRGNT